MSSHFPEASFPASRSRTSGLLGVGKGRGMADLAYVLLIIGVFLLLTLTVRALGRL